MNSFVDTVDAIHPMYVIRATGGALYLSGFLIMIYNVWQTLAGKQRAEAAMTDAAYDPELDRPAIPAAAN